MHQKCLIFGGTGFLGMNLCRMLRAEGYEVTVYGHDSLHAARMKTYFPDIRLVCGNFAETESFDSFIQGMDIIFHLISTTKPSNRDVMAEFTTNVLPTIRLLEACRKKHVRLIYFSSGGTVYGVPRYLPIDEGHRTEPISAYGIHKLAVEKCIEYYGRTYGMDYQICRISNPYGAWQDAHGSQGAVAIFLAKALQGETVELWGDGSVIRDYLDVDDLMDGICTLLSYRGDTRVFNFGSGNGTSLKELLYKIQRVTGRPVSVRRLEGRIQDVPANVLDIAQPQKELGWKPQTTLEAGLRKMIAMWDEEQEAFLPRSVDR